MNSERIKEIQKETAYPDSVSVQQALLQVWNECKQQNKNLYSEEDVLEIFESIISEIEIRKNNIISNSNKMTTHLLEGGCIAFESCKSLIKESLNNLKINNNGK